MKKRAQAAMEFLMTYGWAILVVLIVAAALYAFDVFQTPVHPQCAVEAPFVSCDILSSQGSQGEIIYTFVTAWPQDLVQGTPTITEVIIGGTSVCQGNVPLKSSGMPVQFSCMQSQTKGASTGTLRVQYKSAGITRYAEFTIGGDAEKAVQVEVDISTSQNQAENLQISEGSSRTFTLNGQEVHTLKVESINQDEISIVISSTPVQLTMKAGEVKQVDVNGDGINDMEVQFLGIINGVAQITTKNLSPIPSLSTNQTTTTISGETTTTTSTTTLSPSQKSTTTLAPKPTNTTTTTLPSTTTTLPSSINACSKQPNNYCPLGCGLSTDIDCCTKAGNYWLQAHLPPSIPVCQYTCYTSNYNPGTNACTPCDDYVNNAGYNAVADGTCPNWCSAGNDVDCCQNLGKQWYAGYGCYPKGSAPGTCSATPDSVCPTNCAAGSDADCCKQKGYCWIAGKGCYTCPANTTSTTASTTTSTTTIPLTTTTLPAQPSLINLAYKTTLQQSMTIFTKQPEIDFDSDGKKELVLVKSYGDYWKNNEFKFYENTVDNSFSSVHTLAIDAVNVSRGLSVSYYPADVGDADNDGYKEILTYGRTGNPYFVRLFEASSVSSYPINEQFTVGTGGWTVGGSIADTDNDNKKELIFAGQDFGNAHKLHVYENTANNAYTEVYSASISDFHTSQCYGLLDDADGDGKKEVVYGGLTSASSFIHGFETTGDNAYTETWSLDLKHPNGQVVNCAKIVDLGDTDGDLKKEFLVGGIRTVPGLGSAPWYTVFYVFEATGDNTFQKTATFDTKIVSFDGDTTANAVDLDNDGRKEIIIAAENDANITGIYIFKSISNNQYAEATSITWPGPNPWQILQSIGVGDHDLDTKREIFFNKGTNSPTVMYEKS